jgi:hypothetical protein
MKDFPVQCVNGPENCVRREGAGRGKRGRGPIGSMDEHRSPFETPFMIQNDRDEEDAPIERG